MPGYYQARHAKEILDPLSVNCVAFNDGKKTALIMQFDTEALSDWTADGMRDAILVVAVGNESCGCLDGLPGITSGTRDASHSHHVKVVISVATAKEIICLAPYPIQ